MPEALSEHAFGRWLFSHEEDGARVYRPREDAFAPSRRPRDGFDIEPDGRFRAYAPGPADVSPAREGRWHTTGQVIRIAYDDDGAGAALTIVDAAPGLLKVRRG